MARGLIPFDKRALRDAACLIGIDEAGRGCLAGPVVAAAVSCRDIFYKSPASRLASRGVDDSKRLTPGERAAIVRRFADPCHEKWIQITIGIASVAEIERHNIYQATVLAMRRALGALAGSLPGDPLFEDETDDSGRRVILVDGRPIRTFPHPHQGIVKGDQRSFAIALAGIHAKEHRDVLMRELDSRHPEYRFGEHKGYGTQGHLEALREHGPGIHHRKSFLRKFEARVVAETAASQSSLF